MMGAGDALAAADTRRLTARSCGNRLAGTRSPRDGVVIGSFTSSLIWQAPDGALYGVSTPRYGDLPGAIVVDDAAYQVLRGASIAPGTGVSCDRGRVTFAGSPVTIDFACARRWVPVPDGSIRLGPCDMEAIACALGIIDGARLVRARGGSDPGPVAGVTQDPFATVPMTAIEDLHRGIRDHDEDRVHLAAAALLGRGMGLTPCGDDVLIGTLGALVLIEGRSPLVDRTVRRVCSAALRLTNRYSYDALLQIADGMVFQRLSDFVVAFSGEGSGRIGEAAQALLDYGASSGRFTALGALTTIMAAQGYDTRMLRSCLAF